MTTQLIKEDEELFTILFNEYCLILYGKTYPLTDNNVFNYFVDFYKWYWDKEGSHRIVGYLDNFSIECDSHYFKLQNIDHVFNCIYDNKLYVSSLYKSFNNYLKEINNEGKYN